MISNPERVLCRFMLLAFSIDVVVELGALLHFENVLIIISQLTSRCCYQHVDSSYGNFRSPINWIFILLICLFIAIDSRARAFRARHYVKWIILMCSGDSVMLGESSFPSQSRVEVAGENIFYDYFYICRGKREKVLWACFFVLMSSFALPLSGGLFIYLMSRKR